MRKICIVLCFLFLIFVSIPLRPIFASSMPKDLEIKLEEIPGEVLSDEEGFKVIKKTMEKMKKVKSSDIETNTHVTFNGENRYHHFKGVRLFDKKLEKFTNTVPSTVVISISINNINYERNEGEWKPFEKIYDFRDGMTINKETMDLFKVIKVEDGYVIQTEKKLYKNDLARIGLKNYDTNVYQERKFFFLFQITIDNDGKYKEFTTYSNSDEDYPDSVKIKDTWKYSNYDAGQTIEIPEDLKKVIEEKKQ